MSHRVHATVINDGLSYLIHSVLICSGVTSRSRRWYTSKAPGQTVNYINIEHIYLPGGRSRPIHNS